MAFVLFISSDNPASVPKRPFFKAQRRWNRCRCFFSEPVIATHRWQSGEPSRPSNLLDSFESTSWLCGARPCWRFACRIHCMAAASWHASRDRLQSFLSPGVLEWHVTCSIVSRRLAKYLSSKYLVKKESVSGKKWLFRGRRKNATASLQLGADKQNMLNAASNLRNRFAAMPFNSCLAALTLLFTCLLSSLA